MPDVMQRLLRFGLHRLRQTVQYVHRLVHPAPLLDSATVNFLQCSPKSHGTIPDVPVQAHSSRGISISAAPRASSASIPVRRSQSLRKSLRSALIHADHHQGTQFRILRPQATVDVHRPTHRPTGGIAYAFIAPGSVFLGPDGVQPRKRASKLSDPSLPAPLALPVPLPSHHSKSPSSTLTVSAACKRLRLPEIRWHQCRVERHRLERS